MDKKRALPGVADRTGQDGNTTPCVYPIVTQGREKGKNNVKMPVGAKPDRNTRHDDAEDHPHQMRTARYPDAI